MVFTQRLMWQVLDVGRPAAAAAPPASVMPTGSPVLARAASLPESAAGDKVLLPASALEELSRDPLLEWPLSFQLTTSYSPARTFCGVQEFTSPEGVITLPPSVVEMLGLRLEDQLVADKLVCVRYQRVPKATAITLQPLTSDFLDIADHKSFLESSLRSGWTVLMPGQIITLRYEGRSYQVAVNSAEPKNAPAVSIVNTDCTVHFQEPLNMNDTGALRRHTQSVKVGERLARQTAHGEDYTYFTLVVPEGVDPSSHDLAVEARPAAGSGDVDVFISRHPVRKPTRVSHRWSITAPGGGRLRLTDATRDFADDAPEPVLPIAPQPQATAATGGAGGPPSAANGLKPTSAAVFST
jgi:hypothetical protein